MYKKIFLVVLLFITIFVSGSILCIKKIDAQTGETKRMFDVSKFKIVDIPVDQLQKYDTKVNAIGFQNTIANPFAAAGIIKDLILGGISDAMQGLMYILAMIASLLFWIGAQLIGFFMSLNMAIFDMPLVEVGWKIVRDIANLGFVLAIIVIAVATIVRYEEYGTKKLLPKLIAAAILVNFSLTIGAVFIDFSNTLTNFFISKSSKGGDVISMTTELANGFKAQGFLRSSTQDEKINYFEKKNTVEKSLASILSLVIAALFTFIAAVSLLGIAIMLLVRFMYLSVLLLVSPIIYLFWVIPDTTSVWKSWWHSFMKWVFNAPILTSFLYLTVISITALGKFSENYAKNAGSGISDSLSLTPNILIVIGNSLIMTGLLVGALLIANSLGIVGATTAYSLASKAGKSAKGWALNKTKGAAKSAGRSAVTAGTKTDKDGNTTTALERFGGKYGKIPLIGRAITGISGLSSSARATSSKGVEERIKGLENRTGDDLVALTSRKGLSSEELAATGIATAKKGKWNDLSENTRRSVIDAARKTKTGDKLTEQVPWLAKELGENETKLAAKMNEVPKSAIYEKKNPDGGVMKGADGKPIKEVDPNYEKFVQDNAMNFPAQFKEELGRLPKDTGEAVRGAFQNGLKDKVREAIELDVHDGGFGKDGKPTFTKEKGYEAVEKANKVIVDIKAPLSQIETDIEDMRDKVDKPQLIVLQKQKTKLSDEEVKLNKELGGLRSDPLLNAGKIKEVEEKIAATKKEITSVEKEFSELNDLQKKFEDKKAERKAIIDTVSIQEKKLKEMKDGLLRENARIVSKLDDIAKDVSFKKNKPVTP